MFARDGDGHVRFRRPALQEVAYSEPPVQAAARAARGGRLRPRARAGRELDAGPAVLSNHFALAGDHVRAHRYAMLAAERATDALLACRRGAAVPARDRDRPRVRVGRPRTRWRRRGSRWARRCGASASRRPRAGLDRGAPAARAMTRSRMRGCAIVMPTWRRERGASPPRCAGCSADFACSRTWRATTRRRGERGCARARRGPESTGSLGRGGGDVPPGDRGGRIGRRAERAGARAVLARLGARRIRSPEEATHSGGRSRSTSSSAIPSTS